MKHAKDRLLKYSAMVLAVVAIICGNHLISANFSHTDSSVQENVPDEAWQELEKRIHFQVRNFPGTAGIFIKDLRNGWTISYNSDRPFPSASLVKLPVMASLYGASSQGRLTLDEELPVQQRLKVGGSGKLKFVKNGTYYTIRQLIYHMITESDNTATNILTDYLGLSYYNFYFRNQLGLEDTNFARPIMDLRARNRGIENFTTAQDMAKVLEMIYRNQLKGSKEMIAILKDQKINDRLAEAIPKSWEIGHKTGLMRNGCHDCGIIFSPSGDYIVCVLTSRTHSTRRAKNFISEIAYLTALYFGEDYPDQIPNARRWQKLTRTL